MASLKKESNFSIKIEINYGLIVSQDNTFEKAQEKQVNRHLYKCSGEISTGNAHRFNGCQK